MCFANSFCENMQIQYGAVLGQFLSYHSIASFDLKLFTFYTPHDDQEYQYSSYEEFKEVIEDFLYEWVTNDVY